MFKKIHDVLDKLHAALDKIATIIQVLEAAENHTNSTVRK